MSAAAVATRPGPAGAASGTTGKPTPKPVILQINSTGAWRNVIKFDAADPEACGVVEYHAPAVAVVGGATLRVVTDDGHQAALRYWSLARGWQDWGGYE